MIRKRL